MESGGYVPPRPWGKWLEHVCDITPCLFGGGTEHSHGIFRDCTIHVAPAFPNVCRGKGWSATTVFSRVHWENRWSVAMTFTHISRGERQSTVIAFPCNLTFHMALVFPRVYREKGRTTATVFVRRLLREWKKRDYDISLCLLGEGAEHFCVIPSQPCVSGDQGIPPRLSGEYTDRGHGVRPCSSGKWIECGYGVLLR